MMIATPSSQEVAENITLLSMLSKEPQKPSQNSLKQYKPNHRVVPSRELTLVQERDLVDNLAFLSSVDDDPRKVSAVCVEEELNSAGLIIRMAANTGDMQLVKLKFEKIGRVLEHIAWDGASASKLEALINEVIELDRGRILSRLRSKHAPPSKKQFKKATVKLPTIPQLAEAVSALSTSVRQRGEFEGLEETVSKLQKDFQVIEALPERMALSNGSNSLISALLRSTYHLISRWNLEDLLHNLPITGGFYQESKSAIPMAVSKIARYYGACEFLSAAAVKKKNVFRKIKVDVLPRNAYHIPVTGQETSLQASFVRVLPQDSPVDEAINRALHTHVGLSMDAAERTLHTQMTQPPGHYKVHAEIRLLFYYEQNPAAIPPRVICSSKSACYLCDLFVKKHGQFYIPRTHGVLYGTWRLPDLEKVNLQESKRERLGPVIQQFNEALKATIRVTLTFNKLRMFHPNESLFVNTRIWSTSDLSQRNLVVINGQQALPTPPASIKNNIDGSVTNMMPPSMNAEIVGPISEALWTSSITSMPFQISNIASSQVAVQSPALTSRDYTADPAMKTDRDPSLAVQETENHTVAANPEPPLATRLAEPTSDVYKPSNLSDALVSFPIKNDLKNPDNHLYEHLTMGHAICRELFADGPPLRLSTKHVHVTLSSDTVLHTLFPGSTSNILPAACSVWVNVKWLVHADAPHPEQSINIDDLEPGSPMTTVRDGAAYSLTELFLRRKSDTISIKYAWEASDVS